MAETSQLELRRCQHAGPTYQSKGDVALSRARSIRRQFLRIMNFRDVLAFGFVA